MGDQPVGNSGATPGATPGVALAGVLQTAAGTNERYAGVGDDAVMVAVGQWDAVESWAAARKLAAIRELIRRRPAEGYEPGAANASETAAAAETAAADGSEAAARDGLPDLWRRDLAEEVALELSVSTVAADGLISLAWALGRRLPLTAAALDAGILSLGKARMIAHETSVLSDADARAAEELAAAMWAGKTWGQIHSRITRAVVEVDPAGAEKRREQAERDEARVRFSLQGLIRARCEVVVIRYVLPGVTWLLRFCLLDVVAGLLVAGG
ncbi:MAG TPA: DUF222 domain-containing protein [Streptosporangiaceae bacterium]